MVLLNTGAVLVGTLERFAGRTVSGLRHAFAVWPGGSFVVHVHNVWRNLCEPFGRALAAGAHLDRWVLRRVEWGDKSFDFHGVPQVFVHSFRRREFTGALPAPGSR